MFSLIRFVAFAAILAVSASAVSVVPRQDQNQGQPISAGRPVDHGSDATATFGTTTDSVNWQTMPKGLCIVPEYANEVGLSKEKTPLTTQQAMELCPQATRIAVHKD
ncbi:hypothetical protein FS749_004701 [Ceratobasidium sp. UAMH 11750]|nr:hypothetical protein FS749_004701 [Ceratobasidium sp. UAMH 11750]